MPDKIHTCRWSGEREAELERDIRKSHFSDWQADTENWVLRQPKNAVQTIRNTIQAKMVGVQRGHLAQLDERYLKCFQLTILMLQNRAPTQEMIFKKQGSKA